MRIGFYLNPVARLRELHPSGMPDPALIAALAESAGIQLVLAGWTPSGNQVNERDVLLIRELVRGDLFIVTSLREEAVEPIIKFHPDGVVLLDSGWNGQRPGRPVPIETDGDLTASICASYKAASIPVALLIDPNTQSVKTAARVGASGVVLDCSIYASARTEKDAEEAIDRISNSAMVAQKFGIVASAARGLTSSNIAPVARVANLEEFYFGQTIVSRALIVGVDMAVKELVAATRDWRSNS